MICICPKLKMKKNPKVRQSESVVVSLCRRWFIHTRAQTSTRLKLTSASPSVRQNNTKFWRFTKKFSHFKCHILKKKEKKRNDLGRFLTEWAAHTEVCVSWQGQCSEDRATRCWMWPAAEASAQPSLIKWKTFRPPPRCQPHRKRKCAKKNKKKTKP